MKVQLEKLDVQHQRDKGRFFIDLPGEGTAKLEYRKHMDRQPPIIEFTHTLVSEAYREQGIGSKIVKTGLEHAQNKGYRIKAVCPFVAAYIEDHPKFRDKAMVLDNELKED